MRILISVAGLVAVAITGTWVWRAPGWDSGAALAAVVFAVLAANIWESKRTQPSRVMRQTVGRGGIAIQSGGDTVINSDRVRDNARPQ